MVIKDKTSKNFDDLDDEAFAEVLAENTFDNLVNEFSKYCDSVNILVSCSHFSTVELPTASLRRESPGRRSLDLSSIPAPTR